MGCVASKLEEEGAVVTICKERKHQLKLAVEKRSKLAQAHCKYCQALYAVAASLNLFVSRYSSPPSPFLVSFSPQQPQPTTSTTHENVITNPMFLQQRPSESTTHEALPFTTSCASSSSDATSASEGEEETKVVVEENKKHINPHEQMRVERNDEEGFGYFYMPMPAMMEKGEVQDFGWDFFNPFEGVMPEVVTGYRRSSEEEEVVVVVEREVVKEKKKKKVTVVKEESENVGEVVEGESSSRGLDVIDTHRGERKEGRELLEALKDIVDLFLRACESAKDVSKMLDANKVRLQNGLEEIKGV